MRSRASIGMLVAAFCAAGLFVGTGCGGGGNDNASPGGTKELKIGFSGALSGVYAPQEIPVLNGMKFAANEINAKGGVGGIKVKIVTRDNKNEAAVTTQTTQELLDQGIRVFVLTVADTVIAQGRLVGEAGGVSVLGLQTAPQLVKDIGPSTFLVVFGDNVQAAAAAETACKKGYRTAYTLRSPEIPYTDGLPTFFKQAFKDACGGKVVHEDTYKLGQNDYGAVATKVASARPVADVLYTPMFLPDFGVFLKQLRSEGVKIPVIGADALDTPILTDSTGKSVDGVIYTTHAFPRDTNADARFLKSYKAKTGKAPETYTYEAIGRDNVYALVAAAAKEHSTDPKKIKAALSQFENLQLVTGTLNLTSKTRIPVKPVTLVEMKGTKRTFLAEFTPQHIPNP